LSKLADILKRDIRRGGHDSGSGLEVRAEALAEQLPPLLVAAERVASVVYQGVHGRRRVGQGETFWQFRRYQPGDAPSVVDWRTSGKSDKLYVRQMEWDAAQSVWLWRDASQSMNFRSNSAWQTKRETAELLLVALASLLIRGGERVSLLGSNESLTSARSALVRLASWLSREQAEHAPNMPALSPLPKYARLVWFTDFLVPLDQLKSAIAAYVARGVRGVLVHIIDPAEESLPFAGRVMFSGSEGDGERLVGRVESVQAAYQELFVAHREAVKEIAREAGWTILAHTCDRPPHMALLSLYLALAEEGA